MVSGYEYENLFFEHFATNFVIVDSGATVSILSGAAPVISGEKFFIGNDLIKDESINLSESLCSEKNLKFGKIETSKLAFAFRDSDTVPTDLSGEEIDVYLYFNYDSISLFKVGRYTIENDKYSENNFVRSITAYDMNYYLKDADITSWYYRYFGDGQKHMLGLALVSLFTWIRDANDEYNDSPKMDIELESGYNLCNGTFQMGQTIESDSISFEYFVQKVLEFNGAFGHINRAGKFEFVVLKGYDKPPMRTVTNEYRIPPTEHDIVTTWGIGGVDVYDKDNVRICKYRNSSKKRPSIYNIVDSFVTTEYEKGDATLDAAVKRLHAAISNLLYKSCRVSTTGDLCVEVGDRINVDILPDEGDSRGWFRSYCLERTFQGIQGMTDVYKAKGEQKQPKYIINGNTAHSGDSDQGVDGSDGISVVEDEHDKLFCEIIRNIGFRLLDEPSGVDCEYNAGLGVIKLKWKDPNDIATTEPDTATWAGTVVVRKVGSKPLHEWDGTVIVNSTTKDAYEETWLEDYDIEEDKQYYYGIFPYHVKDGKRWTRFTKVISVNTYHSIPAPSITSAEAEGTEVTLLYLIPSLTVGSYDSIKLAAKKDEIPESILDADKVMDIPEPSGLIPIGTATMGGLDELSTYYFVIFVEDELGNTAYSDAVECMTGKDMGIFKSQITITQGIRENGFKEVIDITQA